MPRFRTTTIGFALIAVVSSATIGVRSLPVPLSSLGKIVGEGYSIILEPAAWKTKPLPIIDWLEGDIDSIKSGLWTLLFYRDDCEHCEKEVTRAFLGGSKTAFIKVSVGRNVFREDDQNHVWLQLREGFDWHVETPSTIRVVNGIVQ